MRILVSLPLEIRKERPPVSSIFRLDFYFKRGKTKGFIEVNGMTLEQALGFLFPDSPTNAGLGIRISLQLRRGKIFVVLLFFNMHGGK